MKVNFVCVVVLLGIYGNTIGNSQEIDKNQRHQKQFDFLSWLFGTNIHPHPRTNQTNVTEHRDDHLNLNLTESSKIEATHKIQDQNETDQIFSGSARIFAAVPVPGQARSRSSGNARHLRLRSSSAYNDHPITKRQAYFGVTQEMLLRAAILQQQQQQQQQQQFYGLQNYQNPLLMSQLYNALGNGAVTRSGTEANSGNTNNREATTKRRRRRPQYNDNDEYDDDDESDEFDFDSDEFANNPFGSAFGR